MSINYRKCDGCKRRFAGLYETVMGKYCPTCYVNRIKTGFFKGKKNKQKQIPKK